MRSLVKSLIAAVAGFGAIALAPMPADAATPTFDRNVAYVRDGNVYLSKGATEKKLTTDGGYSRPRWSRDGKRIAYLRNGLLGVMAADGTGKRQLSNRPAAGAAWSPDGKWLAFASMSCTGGPGVYRVSTTATAPAPEVLFPTDCREQELPELAAPVPASGTLADRLRVDDAVAWSPDGTRIAFRGGRCDSIYDACLSIGNLATGGEQVISAYGGGGQEFSGFAVVPAFRPDGKALSWTAYQEGDDPATTRPVHVVEQDLAAGTIRTVGLANDREMVYAAGKGLVTANYKGGSWVVAVNLSTGARVPFHAGSQPSYQP